VTDDLNVKIAELQKLFDRLEQLKVEFREVDVIKAELDIARRAEEGVISFRTRLADIFAQPDPAFNRFAQLVMSKGLEVAAQDLSNNPDSYGDLKGWSIGPLANAARTAVLKLSLPAAVRTGMDGFTAHVKAGGGGYSREDLMGRTAQIRRRLSDAEERVGSSGRRIELELELAEKAKEISFRDLANLPPEKYRVVETLRDKYRNLIQNREGDPALRAAKAAAKK
jgi:hypothetical protein